MSDVLILGGIGIALIALLILSFKFPTWKKYRKYIAIVLAGIVVLFIRAIMGMKSRDGGKNELQQEIQGIKDNIQEAQQVAFVEVAVARTKDHEKMEELKKVTKISDTAERRKRLALMIN